MEVFFFNEFNRCKKSSWADFTPEHITDFHVSDSCVNKDDKVLDATCGSGGFLVKAMANMIFEAGGAQTNKAKNQAILNSTASGLTVKFMPLLVQTC